MLKITIIICHKCKKGLDNNAQFKLKVAQFYVLQGKNKWKPQLLKVQEVEKNSILRRKNTEIYQKKLLKTLLLSALKFEKVTEKINS